MKLCIVFAHKNVHSLARGAGSPSSSPLITLALVASVALASCASPAPPVTALTTEPAQPMAFTSKSPDAIAHVVKGDMLLDNQRTDEALAEFSAALKLDPGFIYAQVEHGVATPGPAGLDEIERAAAEAKDLTEPERVLIEAALLDAALDATTALSPRVDRAELRGDLDAAAEVPGSAEVDAAFVLACGR